MLPLEDGSASAVLTFHEELVTRPVLQLTAAPTTRRGAPRETERYPVRCWGDGRRAERSQGVCVECEWHARAE
ncbi:hypothetical protein E2C01_073955 [Portunus trituberculatus]|uniref:Uncharacterized protein n=1 Tax=Portunus trituberculatus TaxID=210409 RepID=A0A5B7ID20_PORTR|nr:hypothetical protein [Portunus trituberculatus]